MNKLLSSIRTFADEEDGAQVVEYALIIAVVSIGLVILLSQLLDSDSAFDSFITRVQECLGGAGDCAPPVAP